MLKKNVVYLACLALAIILPIYADAQKGFIVNQSLLFPIQSQHAHGSTLVQLSNGDLLAAWFQGSGERRANDVVILGSRLKKGSSSWSKPFLMADTPNLPDCNPVLFVNQNQKLFLVWIAVQANEWENSILRVRTSTDYLGEGAPNWSWQDNILLNPGKEFEEEVSLRIKELPDPGLGWAKYAPRYDEMIVDASRDPKKRTTGWMTRIKPLQFPDGRIVLPLYSDGYNFSLMAISEDFGESWTPSHPLVGRGPIQPALIQKNDGTLVAYMRDSGDSPTRVHKSESKDKGKTWSASLKTDIPNTASVEMLKLKDGRWAFLGNDIDDGRYRLSLFVSDDEGNSWKWKVRLEDKTKDQGGFSYPAMILGTDGTVHISYSYHQSKQEKSIKYVHVDPDKIR
jgi:predicted neuraminidase